eukprot:6475469-Amphidinium_carterae.6
MDHLWLDLDKGEDWGEVWLRKWRKPTEKSLSCERQGNKEAFQSLSSVLVVDFPLPAESLAWLTNPPEKNFLDVPFVWTSWVAGLATSA